MDPASIAGLAAFALSLLDLAIRTSSIIATLAKKYREASDDVEKAEMWFERHKTILGVWMNFWGISPGGSPNSSGGYDCMSNLWGPEGKTTIAGHLRSLQSLTQQCTELQKQYSSELMRFSEKKRHWIWRKARFAFSGNDKFESINEAMRLQLDTLQSDAKIMFLERHPSFNPGDLSKTAINNMVQEMQELDNVLYIRGASSTILKMLTIPNIAELELKLRRGFTGKETFTLATSKALMEDTVKLPLSFTIKKPHGDRLEANDDPPSVPSASQKLHTVVEFDDKTVHSSVEMRIGRESAPEYQAITHLIQAFVSQAPYGDSKAVYRLSPGLGTPKLIFHDMFADENEEFSHDCMQLPERPLAHLFEELETLGGTDAFQKFPIRDRLELAYLLAVTVMNLHETGWLAKLCSHHVTWGENYEEKKYCSLKVLGQDICENEDLTTPFDIFKKSALRVSANVFSLGLLLHEVGTGQLIRRKIPAEQLPWRPAWHADRLLLQTGNIISNTYASVVETCLKGAFDISTQKHFLSSYFAQVIQPLRELNSIHEPRRPRTPRPIQSSHSKLPWETLSLAGRLSATDVAHLSPVEVSLVRSRYETHAYGKE